MSCGRTQTPARWLPCEGQGQRIIGAPVLREVQSAREQVPWEGNGLSYSRVNKLMRTGGIESRESRRLDAHLYDGPQFP